ncbi:MAG: Plug domain-containing protein [Gemmatimonadaceae bacterium]
MRTPTSRTLRCRLLYSLALLAVSALSCARPAQTSSSEGARAMGSRAARDVLGADEIAGANVHSVYEAIRLLRPAFLFSRGSTSLRSSAPAYPVVYLDGAPAGGLDVLRDIPSGSVKEVRYYNAPDATVRWGTGHTAGVIYVSTKG